MMRDAGPSVRLPPKGPLETAAMATGFFSYSS